MRHHDAVRPHPHRLQTCPCDLNGRRRSVSRRTRPLETQWRCVAKPDMASAPEALVPHQAISRPSKQDYDELIILHSITFARDIMWRTHDRDFHPLRLVSQNGEEQDYKDSSAYLAQEKQHSSSLLIVYILARLVRVVHILNFL